MKITDVQVNILSYQFSQPVVFAHLAMTERRIVMVRIHTDEGLFGIGDTDAEPTGDSLIKELILKNLKPLLIGESPLNIGRLWEKLCARQRSMCRYALESYALGAVDIALWDLLGKILNQPIAVLLGRHRTEVPAYASWSYLPPESIPEKMEQTLREGFTATKIRIGLNNDLDMKIVRTAREVLGETVGLMVDVNAGWTKTEAVQRARRLEAYQLDWIEEPIDPLDLSGYRHLRSKIGTPIATGEHHYAKEQFRDLVLNECADIYQPDPRAGGISECRKIIDFVNTCGFVAIPHCYGSAIKGAATLQLIGAAAKTRSFELNMNADPLRTAIVTDPPEVKNGKITIPDKPGLGITLDEAQVKRHTVG
jgi:L-alanine-DL-glutamate epimerase-like enolase superfamily enzyme